MSRAALASQFLMYTNLIKVKTRKNWVHGNLNFFQKKKNSWQTEKSLTFLRKYIFFCHEATIEQLSLPVLIAS